MAQLESDFSAIWQKVCEQLELATHSAAHPWHLMTVASIDDAGLAQARIVVMRGLEHSKPALWFHTDYRSPKIQQLAKGSQIQLLLYDPKARRQLRCDARPIIHHQNAIAQQRWQNAADTSRRCYLNHHAPSSEIEQGQDILPQVWLSKVPSYEQASEGYQNFCAIECAISAMDILQLNAQGGQRCQLSFEAGALAAGKWLAP